MYSTMSECKIWITAVCSHFSDLLLLMSVFAHSKESVIVSVFSHWSLNYPEAFESWVSFLICLLALTGFFLRAPLFYQRTWRVKNWHVPSDQVLLKGNSSDFTHQSLFICVGECRCMCQESSVKLFVAPEGVVWNLQNCRTWCHLAQGCFSCN